MILSNLFYTKKLTIQRIFKFCNFYRISKILESYVTYKDIINVFSSLFFIHETSYVFHFVFYVRAISTILGIITDNTMRVKSGIYIP